MKILTFAGRCAKEILRDLHSRYGSRIYISLMNQYTVLADQVQDYPELNRTITEEEYAEAIEFAARIGITQGFIQEGGTAKESFIPSFNGEGVIK